MKTKLSTIWDPIGANIDDKKLSKDAQEIEQQLQHTIDNQKDFERGTRLIIGLTITALVVAAFFVLASNIEIEHAIEIFTVITVTGFAFFGVRIATRGEIATDAAKLLIAKKEHWLYDPKQDTARWQALVTHIPEIFKRGSNQQRISDQYWGTWNGMPFWSGVFTFEQQEGKSSTTYHRTVYSFKLPRKAVADLSVLPKRYEKRVARKIQLESNEFNRLFHIHYNHKEVEKLQQIYEVLHPALMATLMDLHTTVGEYFLTFEQDVGTISVPGATQLEHTNLHKFTGVDPRDVTQFESNLQYLLNSAKQIVQNLD